MPNIFMPNVQLRFGIKMLGIKMGADGKPQRVSIPRLISSFWLGDVRLAEIQRLEVSAR